MDNQIVIHAAGSQKRIALIENSELAQFFIESPENRRSVGDIYLAQVHKVMGGIRACFIDLSTPKDGFLHYSDLGEHLEEYIAMLNGRDSIPKKASDELLQFRQTVAKNEVKNMTSKDQTMHEQNLLGSLLKPGQKVMVQVVKEPIGSKGPRVSTDITLAGRFLVLIPFGDYVAVSKRIRSYKERRRLKSIISEMLPNGFGVIVRTVAEAQDDDVLREDLKDLHDKWVDMQDKLKTAKPTALLHRDLDMTESLIRDLFSKNYDRILVDDTETFKAIKGYIGRVAPSMVKNVVQYKGREHVFDHMNISRDVNSIFSPRVKMPSGGYLIFEQTEAMYVVDVNSGRYAAKKAQEDNSLKTNLEAAREIAKQLRLRDIGGIIVVDFIDLQQDSNRKKIYDEIKKEFKKDRAKTNILPMSDFGLMQITRQRIRPSVVKSVSKVCPMCGGSGSIVSESTLLSDIEAWLSKFSNNYKYKSVDLYVNPFFHSVLLQGLISTRLKWMFKFFMRISINPDDTISLNDFKATLHGSEFDIYETVSNGESIEDAIRQNEKNLAELESGGRKNTELLDIYKKNGRNGDSETRRDRDRGASRDDYEGGSRYGQQQSGRGGPKTAEANEEGTERGRRRPAAVRITSQGRSNTKLKSKYYKSGSEDEHEPGTPQKPERLQQDQNQSARKTAAEKKEAPAEKPDALEVAKAHALEEKPNALEVAKAYARKLKLEEAKAEMADKKDSDATSEKGVTAKAASQVSDKNDSQPDVINTDTKQESKTDKSSGSDDSVPETAAAPKQSARHKQEPQVKAEETENPKTASGSANQPENKADSDSDSDSDAGSASALQEPDAEAGKEPKAKIKAPKRVKRQPRPGGKKVIAKPPKARKKQDDDPVSGSNKAAEADPSETKPTPAEKKISDAKVAKLREMDELKAKLSEDAFRKPADIPASDLKKSSVVTKTVSPRKAAPETEAAPQDTADTAGKPEHTAPGKAEETEGKA
ncbi:MAG: Rne/Rng family ribonuclease [Balneolales bacterium]|nr:Rne/Rng family ribonuclease [Balneolales bacterium]